jgi:hypothetical protein
MSNAALAAHFLHTTCNLSNCNVYLFLNCNVYFCFQIATLISFLCLAITQLLFYCAPFISLHLLQHYYMCHIIARRTIYSFLTFLNSIQNHSLQYSIFYLEPCHTAPTVACCDIKHLFNCKSA